MASNDPQQNLPLNVRSLAVLILIMVFLAVYFISRVPPGEPIYDISYSRFTTLLNDGDIASLALVGIYAAHHVCLNYRKLLGKYPNAHHPRDRHGNVDGSAKLRRARRLR